MMMATLLKLRRRLHHAANRSLMVGGGSCTFMVFPSEPQSACQQTIRSEGRLAAMQSGI